MCMAAQRLNRHGINNIIAENGVTSSLARRNRHKHLILYQRKAQAWQRNDNGIGASREAALASYRAQRAYRAQHNRRSIILKAHQRSRIVISVAAAYQAAYSNQAHICRGNVASPHRNSKMKARKYLYQWRISVKPATSVASSARSGMACSGAQGIA